MSCQATSGRNFTRPFHTSTFYITVLLKLEKGYCTNEMMKMEITHSTAGLANSNKAQEKSSFRYTMVILD